MRFLELQIERGDAERDLHGSSAGSHRTEGEPAQNAKGVGEHGVLVARPYRAGPPTVERAIAAARFHSAQQGDNLPTDPGRPEGSNERLWQGGAGD
jgi:hypothetical protein